MTGMAVRRNPSAIAYLFTNFGGVDGIDLGTACASRITISGKLYGVKLDPTTVDVGHDNAHPDTFPFTIKKEVAPV